MTIQEYLERVVPKTLITDGVHIVTVDITQNNRDLYEKGIRLGMEFANWRDEDSHNLWVSPRTNRVVSTDEELFELFLTEKFK
jgi:hypothetical protein